MAFLVETGEGIPLSNAYVSVAFADAYHTDRGHGSWTPFGTTEKQQAIVRATDYIDKRFGRKFRGRSENRDQGCEWPRVDAFDDDGFLFPNLPSELMEATCEYALRAALKGELAPDPLPVVPGQDLGPTTPEEVTEFAGGQISRISEKVDVIEETKSFVTPDRMINASRNRLPMSVTNTDALIPEYPAADLLLQILLESGRRKLKRG